MSERNRYAGKGFKLEYTPSEQIYETNEEEQEIYKGISESLLKVWYEGKLIFNKKNYAPNHTDDLFQKDVIYLARYSDPDDPAPDVYTLDKKGKTSKMKLGDYEVVYGMYGDYILCNQVPRATLSVKNIKTNKFVEFSTNPQIICRKRH